jgi:CubicO group peptidase (beta-lactamase class C family)
MIAKTLVLGLTAALCGTGAQAQTDSEIRAMLVERVDVLRHATGMVVGIVGPSGRRVIAYGTMAKDDKRPMNGDTLFEIGSLTKVFTSLVLADMVQHGEVSLDDPVAKYLPAGVKVPERGGRSITLVDLATHTSGLPRIPNNMRPKDFANPYADYSAERLYQFLGAYSLPRDIGSQYEYSNLGAGLLGLALARRAGTSYEALIRSRICDPLGMSGTRVSLSPELKARLATGHDATLAPRPNWDFDALAGAGALKSSANDLLNLLSMHLGYLESPLSAAWRAWFTTAARSGTYRSPGSI